MVQQNIKIMTRNELKQMWFNLPTVSVVTKTILVEMDKYEGRKGQGTIQITSDGPDGFSQFKTHQEFPIKYVQDRINSDVKYKEYKLVIKQYDKEIRKQMGRSNNGDINHNNDNNKMMKYPKIVGWSVVIGMWSIMGVSLHQMKKSEQQNKENIEVIAEEMIEWMYEDVENDRIPEWTAKEYINDLEQIIKEVK